MIVLQGARERVEVLQFSPDGRTLVAPSSGRVQVWDKLTAGGQPRVALPYHDIWSVRFTPDGRQLLLGGSRRAVIHDLPTGEAAEVPLDPGEWEEYCDEVYCDLIPDGRFLVAAHQVTTPEERTSRLLCRSVANPASPVWFLNTPRLVYSPPLFLTGGERFVVFEWWSELPPY